MQYTRNGLLYPEEFDLVREGSDLFEQLCRAIDPEPVALTVTPTFLNWTAQDGLATQIGPFVYWKLAMTRTGAAITTDATGNIVTDVPVFTGLTAPYRPYRMVSGSPVPTTAPVRCIKSANHDLYGYVDETGACTLTHGWPNQTYAAGAGYQFIAFYLLNF